MMKDVLVPGWLVAIFLPSIIIWMIWVTVNMYKNGTDIKLNEANDISFRAEIRKDVQEIKSSISNLTSTMLGLFGEEISMLKAALKVNNQTPLK